MSEVEEALARLLHTEYVRHRLRTGAEGDTPSLTSWHALPAEYKRSTRRNARDLLDAVRDLGLQVVEAGSHEPDRLDAREIDSLAETLHERWVEERSVAGWRPGSRRDDIRRVHPDLVPWHELADERREIDRVFGRELPRLLESIGFVLTRTEVKPPRPVDARS